MIYEKRYLQFNSLVFDGYDMISDFDEEASFKGDPQSYSYGHGAYMPFKQRYMFTESKSVNMTITLHMKKIPCEYRNFYARFAEEELSKPGKLWAVKNNEVIWANAFAQNLTPIMTGKKDTVEWDIEFVIPSGVWNKADKLKTFVLPYDVCLFMDCKGYKGDNACPPLCEGDGGDCCQTCIDSKSLDNTDCFCCCIDELSPDMALCYHTKEIQELYGCDTPFQLVYSCEHAEKFNKDYELGQKLCTKDICNDSIIAGLIYSDTDIPTDDVTVVIHGTMYNPNITINGNTNVIQGEYDGTLTIKPNGEIYYQKSDCCDPKLLGVDVWTIPSGNDWGWTINPRNNSVIVNLNRCCNGHTCVYIQHEGLTL